MAVATRGESVAPARRSESDSRVRTCGRRPVGGFLGEGEPPDDATDAGEAGTGLRERVGVVRTSGGHGVVGVDERRRRFCGDDGPAAAQVHIASRQRDKGVKPGRRN